MIWIAQNFATVLRAVLGHADKSTERQEANEEKAAAAGWSWPEQRIAGNTDMYSYSNTRKAKTGNSHSASSNYPAMPSGRVCLFVKFLFPFFLNCSFINN
jgi:hypothetical protein